MEGSGKPGTGNTDTAIGGDAQFVSNLTVWETPQALGDFVWNTVHRQFYNRRAEWFEVLGKMHFVMSWIPAGHRPKLTQALDRLDHLSAHGDSDHAFAWSYLKDADQWRKHQCDPVAAE